jgi:capsular exopolysaccharide synthesis family protein
VRILDLALPSKHPIQAGLVTTVPLAAVIGLLLACALCLGLEALDNTIKTEEQAETELGVPVLGMIPIIGTGKKAIRSLTPDEQKLRDLSVFRDTHSQAAEACRSIRTNLLFLSSERPTQVLLVTSPGPREGKTTTSISLAVTMAQAGGRILLIDGDFRRPRIHHAFGVSNERGMTNAIVLEEDIGKFIVPTEIPNLDLLPAGMIPPNPSELLHTKRFAEIIADCRARYDKVILDSPPTSLITDPIIASTQTDGVVLVLRAAHTTRQSARYARRQLADVNANILGSVVNYLDPATRYYGSYYGHRGYGHYQYGKGYGYGESAKS